MMTCKHYTRVETILRECVADPSTMDRLVFRFSHMFQLDNPSFDVGRFERGCWGLPDSLLCPRCGEQHVMCECAVEVTR